MSFLFCYCWNLLRRENSTTENSRKQRLFNIKIQFYLLIREENARLYMHKCNINIIFRCSFC